MKIVVCWSHISGYMAASWRALAAVPGVSVFVIGFEADAVAPFDAALLGDLPYRLLDAKQRLDAAFVGDLVRQQRPDALMVSGWAHPAYRAVITDPAWATLPKVMTMDTQLRYDLRQSVGRFVRRPYLKRITRVAVAGERAAATARYLGFAGSQIRIGFCGIDFSIFGGLLARRSAGPWPWPRKFLYVGRYAPEKALDVLAEGYSRYRAAAGADAWDLVCCGRGPEAHRLKRDGITDLGFVPPDRQADVFAGAGAFVMASANEPWGVAIAEAAASGLPLVCSDACGAASDVLRDGYNGHVFDTGDPAHLARRLAQVQAADLPLWGGRSRVLAEAFSSESWPGRIFGGLLPDGRGYA